MCGTGAVGTGSVGLEVVKAAGRSAGATANPTRSAGATVADAAGATAAGALGGAAAPNRSART
ncbi:MAG: hypothetical protein GWN71_29080 [Gammaproteobacteria bacterium]|nr:hypothetical protein [Gemmatimonadota bacterium]NIU77461.1 hypothetical protein [Gammaproteobacteria bacterium]